MFGPKGIKLKYCKGTLYNSNVRRYMSEIKKMQIGYSVFDLKDVFWQIKLDKENAKLCTFGTIFGA